jgi:SAM-dependent methyltransferase
VWALGALVDAVALLGLPQGATGVTARRRLCSFAVDAIVDSNNFPRRAGVIAIRKLIKEITPSAIVQLCRKSKIRAERSHFSVMSTADVFDEIYRRKLWGADGTDSALYSGSGSRGAAARQCVDAVTTFINGHAVDSILDIGCGDFYIGKAIIERLGQPVNYTGIDVSPYVIAYNREHYSIPNVSFVCLDAAKDELPCADICLVRQVLQHLSNQQISSILRKLICFKWVLVTEHYPDDDRFLIENLDKPHGEDTRLRENSAVYIDRPPFKMEGVKTLLEVRVDMVPGVPSYIRTLLVTPGRNSPSQRSKAGQ